VSGPGRGGTGNRRYRRNREVLLAHSDVCAICGHPGSRTADHIISDPLWPRDPMTGKRLPGFDELGNLQPAHGTMGPYQPANPCPTCHRLCNQSKGDGRRSRREVRPQSRQWL
jgi:hypothetical protein